MTLEFSQQIFEKSSNIKFHEIASSDSRVVPYGRRGGRNYRRTDMTWLIAAVRNFANAPKHDNDKIIV